MIKEIVHYFQRIPLEGFQIKIGILLIVLILSEIKQKSL